MARTRLNENGGDRYEALRAELDSFLPEEAIITEPLRRFAYGTDASCYRMVPRIVVRAPDERAVVRIVEAARRHGVGLTFRAAGTSLAGQAVTDSVLVLLTDAWRGHRIEDDAKRIVLQPGVIGAHANAYLAPYGRKIGPDPASIGAAMIGGIVANNASGMCCGTRENSYQTLASMRIVLADGTVVDTGDERMVARFRESHDGLLGELEALAQEVRANERLAEKIRRKYRLKNTTGYGLNALLDFEDPVDILQHLMVGSEGTLGCMTEVTYHTVVDQPCKASALVFFPDIRSCCQAVSGLKKLPVSAVELMDRACLRSIEDLDGLPAFMRSLSEGCAALLVETRAADTQTLSVQITQINECLRSYTLEAEIPFTDRREEYEVLWSARKGAFPRVGAMREKGTTVIIEDVAFPIERLADGVAGLQRIFAERGYPETVIFGHALEGNLHFVFTQAFETPEDIGRYRRFLDAVCQLVAVDFEGSLKGEHGTGRNMAPYISLEWGEGAYDVMKRIKRLLDPDNILNPGVLINDDPEIHVKNLKPIPPADDIVDTCIECGFCERTCPASQLTLSPRQRITVWREIQRMRRECADQEYLAEWEKEFQYSGVETCAVPGVCAQPCPMSINTGELIHKLRVENATDNAPLAAFTARHFAALIVVARFGLTFANLVHRLVGTRVMARLTRFMRRLSGNRIPEWWPTLPAGAKSRPAGSVGPGDSVAVYVPACVSRGMGPQPKSAEREDQIAVIERVLGRAGYSLRYPEGLDALCCGLPYASKGFDDTAEKMQSAWQEALLTASEQGRYPVLIDTSPCNLKTAQCLPSDSPLRLYEPFGFIDELLLDRLSISPLDEAVMIHLTCSSRRKGLERTVRSVAGRCAKQAIVPEHIECCGFSGDRGFNFPELTRSALAPLKEQIPKGCTRGYSNSRTCEIGLSGVGGIEYRSIFYLVDEVSRQVAGTQEPPAYRRQDLPSSANANR
jgi:D-lactate dehydrogenase